MNVNIYARHADDNFGWIPKPIDRQGPVLGYDITLNEITELLLFPQVWIYDADTQTVINFNNLHEYFPEYYPPGETLDPGEISREVSDAVARIVANAPEDFDTLKEMSDWISGHEESAAAMNSAIQNKLDKEDAVGKNVTGTEYTIDGTTVIASAGAEIFNSYSGSSSAKATGSYSHAEGSGTKATGSYSHAEGSGTKATGSYSHAEGYNSIASGKASHAEGWYSRAEGFESHAEGWYSRAEGFESHAEGYWSTASGYYSHAEGSNSTASEYCSHVEGNGTTASGSCSHAEGNGTTASGSRSHAEGSGTEALSTNQHVQGKYNIADANNKYAFIIGNGTDNNARSNAFAVDWDGLIYQNNSENGVDLNQMSEKMNKTSTTWKGTQAEYDALESKSEYDMYCIYEDDEA